MTKRERIEAIGLLATCAIMLALWAARGAFPAASGGIAYAMLAVWAAWCAFLIECRREGFTGRERLACHALITVAAAASVAYRFL